MECKHTMQLVHAQRIVKVYKNSTNMQDITVHTHKPSKIRKNILKLLLLNVTE